MEIKYFFINFSKKPWLWLTAVTLAALALRLWLLAQLKSLTFDEMISFSVAAKPLGQVWSYVRWEMHPPFHYYFLHFWFDLFGTSEVSAHLSSVFLSVAAVIALYFLGKELFNSRLAGLAAAAFYSFSPLFCFFGVWSRMYTMLFLTATLSFLFFIRLIKAAERHTVWPAIFFTIATLAALFSHLTAGLVVAIEVVYLAYLLLSKKNKFPELWSRFWAPAVIIIAAYGSWFWFFWHQRLVFLAGNAWYFAAQENASPLVIFVCDSLKYLTPFDGYFFNLLAFSLWAILVFSAFASVSFFLGQKNFQIKGSFSDGALFSCLIYLIAFVGLFAARLFVLRYAIIPAIGLFLLFGYGYHRASRPVRLAAAALFIILTVISFWTMGRTPLYSVDWQGAAKFIAQNERPGDKIIGSLYTNILSLDFYYRGSLPISAPLDEKYRGDDLLLTTIKTNVYPTTNRENINQLSDFLGDSRRVFLIVSEGDGAFPGTAKIAEDWLAARGFSKTGEWPVNSGSSTLIWVMEKK